MTFDCSLNQQRWSFFCCAWSKRIKKRWILKGKKSLACDLSYTYIEQPIKYFFLYLRWNDELGAAQKVFKKKQQQWSKKANQKVICTQNRTKWYKTMYIKYRGKESNTQYPTRRSLYWTALHSTRNLTFYIFCGLIRGYNDINIELTFKLVLLYAQFQSEPQSTNYNFSDYIIILLHVHCISDQFRAPFNEEQRRHIDEAQIASFRALCN